MEIIEDDIMTNLKSIHNQLPKVRSAWKIHHLSNITMLIRQIINSNKCHADFEELPTHEDMEMKLHDVYL